jgi:hypothetical protein
MTSEKFDQLWRDIQKPDFQRTDLILKNPAPTSVPVEEVLKKMANLLSNCLNLKVLPPKNTAFTKIQGVG